MKLVLLHWQSKYYCIGKVSTTALAREVLLRWQGKYYYDETPILFIDLVG